MHRLFTRNSSHRLPARVAMVWLLLSFCTGPALAQLYAKPVVEPAKAYVMDGYEILPPRGAGWFEMKRERDFIYFGKRLSSPTHSFIAVVLTAPVAESFETADAFREHVARQLAETGGDLRSRPIVIGIETDTAAGPYCVRYQTRTEDRGAANARGRTLFADTIGLSCLHPQKKSLAIDASYTERGLPSETGTLLRDEGESFIRGLKFLPPR